MLKLEQVESLSFEVVHRSGSVDLHYVNLVDYYRNRLSLWSNLRRPFRSAYINVRKRSIKFIEDEHVLLEKLIHLSLQENSSLYSFSGDNRGEYHWILFSKMYGDLSLSRADYNFQMKKFTLLLDSLAKEEALIRASNTYKIGPKAISSMNKHVIERRRHRDRVVQNWILIALTFVLAASAVIELFGLSLSSKP